MTPMISNVQDQKLWWNGIQYLHHEMRFGPVQPCIPGRVRRNCRHKVLHDLDLFVLEITNMTWNQGNCVEPELSERDGYFCVYILHETVVWSRAAWSYDPVNDDNPKNCWFICRVTTLLIEPEILPRQVHQRQYPVRKRIHQRQVARRLGCWRCCRASSVISTAAQVAWRNKASRGGPMEWSSATVAACGRKQKQRKQSGCWSQDFPMTWISYILILKANSAIIISHSSINRHSHTTTHTSHQLTDCTCRSTTPFGRVHRISSSSKCQKKKWIRLNTPTVAIIA